MPNPVATVAFSGAGHLLAYHLGVASVLRQAPNKFPQIQAVSGSSSGAIAAAVLALLPHRLDDYADRFLQDRGRAFQNFQEILKEEEYQQNNDKKDTGGPSLHICVAKCEDGSPWLFQFSALRLQSGQEQAHLVKAIQASCRIPLSFHPLDLFQTSVSYDNSEGIEIDSNYYVDGGISGVFPPPLNEDLDPNVPCHRILVSPISLRQETTTISSHNCQSHLIQPTSRNALFPWGPKLRGGNVRIVPSVANLRSLLVSAGIASSVILKDWYERGKEDAAQFLEKQDF